MKAFHHLFHLTARKIQRKLNLGSLRRENNRKRGNINYSFRNIINWRMLCQLIDAQQ